MPAGAVVVGHKHKTQHLNIISKGRCEVMIGGEIRTYEAPVIFESLAESQKLLYIFEDTVWTTVHVNDDDVKDVDMLEDKLIYKDNEHELCNNGCDGRDIGISDIGAKQSSTVTS